MAGLGQLDEPVGRGCGSGEVEQIITVDGVLGTHDEFRVE